jgi:hypothetical protein
MGEGVDSSRSSTMNVTTALVAVGLAVGAAPLSAQVIVRDDPRDRRPSSTGGVFGDIIFGDGTTTSRDNCRVRDARTPDGRIVQICDPAYENRRDGRGRKAHKNDMDGDGDFDARDRAIRKRQHELAKAEKKRLKEWHKRQRRGDD